MGPTGVDVLALERVARAYSIPIDCRFFELVKVYEEEALKVIREKVKGAEGKGECSKEQEGRCRVEFGKYFEWACKKCKEKKQKASVKDA